ncbi:long chain acyl-CoA synthetase 7, peroxisomal isoform X5 [Ziziphus jujuba]|uniref:Long chain acyl-CoA synthetase 7, peroxisomal isoform X5 n=1 Tax=Ziziphus jujuba TaxID=326968 RepID=A0ABM3IBM2_ZIZJJ|nr:long chain acyl-CoA synthetase 7, peroxisomal isoform X5 [Ziziphus jujuba]
MESPAQRRLRAIRSHLLPNTSDDDPQTHIRSNITAGEFAQVQGYSVVLPEKLQTGKWNVYRSARSPFQLVSRFADHPEIGTLHDNFVHAVETFRDHKYLGTRVQADGSVGEYKWMTYGEAGTARKAVGSGLQFNGLQKGDCVGIYFINRPEWLIVDHACAAFSYISVPLYDTLGPDAVRYVVNHADVRAIFCVPQTLNSVVGGIDEHLPSLPSASGVKLISYSRLTVQDNLKLMDDIAVLRPTLFCSVPRLYNRIYAGITNSVSNSGLLKERLFKAAYNSKKHTIMSGQRSSPIWDRLVFNKIRDKLGGRVRFLGSGASPLSPDVMDFLRVCFGCQVLEGYGMTETSCIISIMDEGDNLSGHVGSPNTACEIKLVDVPEMNYTSEDQPYPRGEICVRGPIIFQGYYKNEVQTREVLDDDGWLHTGDIGLWLPGGRLKIIDRKKNIFKLAQGEYIAPEKVENVYSKCKFVSQCFIYGDSFNATLVAIIAVDPDVLKEWASSAGIKYEDVGQLCNDPRARAAVLADMDEIGREAQLRGFEYAKAVTLVPEAFTLENGLLTPTFKIKRPQAKEYFARAISDMYAELSKSDPTMQKM